MIQRIYILLAFIFFYSCSIVSQSSNGTIPTKSPPIWITQQPNINHSWVGIGYADKTDDSYREISRKRATVEIAEQIKVQIISEFNDVMTELNSEDSEYSQSIIESRLDMMMEDAKIMDFYETRSGYYVYMELDKATYYRKLNLKKEKAMEVALDFISDADNNLSVESFDYLSRAMTEINPFLNMTLDVEYPIGSGNTTNLYSAINILSRKITNRIVISSNKDEVTLIIGEWSENEFLIKCEDLNTGKAIPGIPLKASLNDLDLNQAITSDENGLASFNLFELTENTPVQYFHVELDLSNIKGNTFITKPVKTSIKVNALLPPKPVIFFSIDENILGKENTNPMVTPLIKEFFRNYFDATFTDKKSTSTLALTISLNVVPKSKKKNEYGLYQVYADASITLFDSKKDKEFFQKSINNIQGADFTSLEGAARVSLEKMSEKLESDIFEQISVSLDEILE